MRNSARRCRTGRSRRPGRRRRPPGAARPSRRRSAAGSRVHDGVVGAGVAQVPLAAEQVGPARPGRRTRRRRCRWAGPGRAAPTACQPSARPRRRCRRGDRPAVLEQVHAPAGVGEGRLDPALELDRHVRQVRLDPPRVALVDPHAVVLDAVGVADDLVAGEHVAAPDRRRRPRRPGRLGQGVADPAPASGDRRSRARSSVARGPGRGRRRTGRSCRPAVERGVERSSEPRRQLGLRPRPPTTGDAAGSPRRRGRGRRRSSGRTGRRGTGRCGRRRRRTRRRSGPGRRRCCGPCPRPAAGGTTGGAPGSRTNVRGGPASSRPTIHSAPSASVNAASTPASSANRLDTSVSGRRAVDERVGRPRSRSSSAAPEQVDVAVRALQQRVDAVTPGGSASGSGNLPTRSWSRNATRAPAGQAELRRRAGRTGRAGGARRGTRASGGSAVTRPVIPPAAADRRHQPSRACADVAAAGLRHGDQWPRRSAPARRTRPAAPRTGWRAARGARLERGADLGVAADSSFATACSRKKTSLLSPRSRAARNPGRW